MNSVTIVRKFRMNRSPTENAPQNFPNRSMISRAWPTPVTHTGSRPGRWIPECLGQDGGRDLEARVNRAVLRLCRGLMPRAWSRWASASLSARPGQRPGKSQREWTLSRLLPGRLQPSASPVTRASSGAGKTDRAAAQAKQGAAASCKTCWVVRADDVELLGAEQDEEPGGRSAAGQVPSWRSRCALPRPLPRPSLFFGLVYPEFGDVCRYILWWGW